MLLEKPTEGSLTNTLTVACVVHKVAGQAALVEGFLIQDDRARALYMLSRVQSSEVRHLRPGDTSATGIRTTFHMRALHMVPKPPSASKLVGFIS